MARGKFISYLRVSTDKQGRNGLGMEAQRQAVENYLNGGSWELLEEYVEVESGKRDDRPQLQKAGVRFVAADMPEANETMVGFMAIMAQHEREMISRRTKEALAAAKARGVKLGNPNGAKHLREYGNAAGVAAIKAKAAERAEDLRPVVAEIRSAGVASNKGLARELNRRGVLTPRGGRWHPTSVARLLGRLQRTAA